MKGNRVILNTAILLISSMSLLKLSAQNENSCVPTNLRCEHLERPLGIDRQSPRFSWNLSDTRNGAKQTAYQIAVGKDSLALSKGKGTIGKEDIRRPNADHLYGKGLRTLYTLLLEYQRLGQGQEEIPIGYLLLRDRLIDPKKLARQIYLRRKGYGVSRHSLFQETNLIKQRG